MKRLNNVRVADEVKQTDEELRSRFERDRRDTFEIASVETRNFR